MSFTGISGLNLDANNLSFDKRQLWQVLKAIKLVNNTLLPCYLNTN